MDQKWMWILMILLFCQNMTAGNSGDVLVKENQPVNINCKPPIPGTMVVWFRVLETSGMEFIASFSPTGVPKSPASSYSSVFSHSGQSGTLTLRSFNKIRDSGVYSCASLKGSELNFGPTTRLFAEKVTATVKTPEVTSNNDNLCTTATPCVCTNMKPGKAGRDDDEMSCNPVILGSLAGGCGLLLLILIITTLYCNQIRTRRCPHHYKRKPRMAAPGKQMMNNRNV